MFDWLTVDSYLLWIGVGTATLVFLYWAGRAATWMVRKIRRTVALVKEFLRRAGAMLDLAEEQLKPNHGSSLADRAAMIPSLHESLQQIATRQEEQHDEAKTHWAHLHEADEVSSKEVGALREDVGAFRAELDERATQLAVRIDHLGAGQETLATRLDEGAAFWNRLLEAFLSGVFGPDMERVGKYVQQQIAEAGAANTEGE